MNLVPATIPLRSQSPAAALQPNDSSLAEELFSIREQLIHLTELLPGAIRFRNACRRAAAPQARRRRRWREGVLFSFHPNIEREWQAGRAPERGCVERWGLAVSRRRPLDAQAWQSFTSAAPQLVESVMKSAPARRLARCIRGLSEGLRALAPDNGAARDLNDLLAVQDDAVYLVFHPETGRGWRIHVEGIESCFQLQILIADLLARDLDVEEPDPRIVAQYRGEPVAVPELVAAANFSMYARAAMKPDGTLANGLGDCDHCLWGALSPAHIPLFDGERVILLGPPPFRLTWEMNRRFPQLAGSARVVESLAPRIADESLQLMAAAAQDGT